MKPMKHGLPALGVLTVLQLAMMEAYAGPLQLAQSPLFLSTATKANVLMMYGNSNSMDTDPTGLAVGSDKPTSKSEIARKAMIAVIDGYTGYINMGLLAYQQKAMVVNYIHSSQYDVSYNPANFDPAFNGARNALTKKFRAPNPTAPGKFIYYNVNLPYYDPNPAGTAFCTTPTSCTSPTRDFKGTAPACTTPEHPNNGPWDATKCYPSKSNTSDSLDATAGGYSGGVTNTSFIPSDSDLGQGITDFGKLMAYQQMGKAWFDNTSPGKGYMHLPVQLLDANHATNLKKKLAVSQFSNNKPEDDAFPLQNSGLSPLAGTVRTAKNYFAGSLTETAQGGPMSAPPQSCQKNFLVTLTDGLPSVGIDGTASADVVQNLAALTTEVKALREATNKAETYVVGFALPYGVSITQLDTIAAAGGSGAAYYADDTATLNAAFGKIFASIMSKTASASAVSLSSQSVAQGANVFQARFGSGDWSGDLIKYGFKNVQVGGSTIRQIDQDNPLWNAAAQLKAKDPNTRAIVTVNPGTKKGVPFRWPVNPLVPAETEMTLAQVQALSTAPNGAVDANGSARLNYLRGASTNEGDSGLKFRPRPLTPLGDLVNSAPHYVAVPNANYGLAGYATFRTERKSRAGMIYAGANDGMLHGFDAATGAERIAFIPGNLVDKLNALTVKNYAHRYYVDGSPMSGDVEFGAGIWRTMLVGGLGAGGRGVYGLDVTDPAQFSETNAAGLVKFELNEKTNARLGNISGPPSIVKLNSGKWAAVFGNGYNSGGNGGSGEAVLFVVDIQSGAVIRELKAGTDTANLANGLSEALVIDKDNNYTADVVYAGDLQGNMWKFDLSDKNEAQWSVSKLFQAPQAITAAPDAGEHPKGGYIVFFGTGKYLEGSDVGSTPGNAMYGVWDNGTGEAAAGSLVSQTLSAIPAIGGKQYRVASSNPVDYTTKRGWTVPFPGSSERAVSTPQLRDGRVISVSLIPSAVECTPGGDSWLNELDWLTGGQLAKPPLDTNGDSKVNSLDTIVAGAGVGGVIAGPGIQDIGPNLVSNVYAKADGTAGELIGSADSRRARRLSWRQIK